MGSRTPRGNPGAQSIVSQSDKITSQTGLVTWIQMCSRSSLNQVIDEINENTTDPNTAK